MSQFYIGRFYCLFIKVIVVSNDDDDADDDAYVGVLASSNN